MVFLHIDTKNYDQKDENGETPIAILNNFIKHGKHIFVLIYMEGCGPCNATRPEWKKLENILDDDNSNILVVDIDKDLLDKVKNFGSEPKGFPTIRYISNKGKTTQDFEDSDLKEEHKTRTIDSFIEWIKLKSKDSLKGGKRKLKKNNSKKTHKKRITGGKWSRKYKMSINCKRPKGFSQKQYCKYSRKRH
jgi:hypothetical protein